MSDWQGWPQDEELRNLLLKYFLNFARFEFAMKTGGFGTDQRGFYEPSYSELTKAMQLRPFPDCLKLQHQYLWDHPPKKQTGPGSWKPIKLADDWSFPIKCIKTVRNNLFHGGKMPFDSDRDARLICHCDSVLQTLVDHAPDEVRNQFRAAP